MVTFHRERKNSFIEIKLHLLFKYTNKQFLDVIVFPVLANSISRNNPVCFLNAASRKNLRISLFPLLPFSHWELDLI